MGAPIDAKWNNNVLSDATLDQVTYGQGTSFPATWPTTRLFWRTDTNTLYKNIGTEGSPTWEQISDSLPALGNALEHLRVNSGGSALEYAAISGVLPQGELSNTPVADASQEIWTAGRVNYTFFTLPTTEDYYLITGIEWKNGTSVGGIIMAGAQIVDAENPTDTIRKLVCYTAPVTQSGVSAVQRNNKLTTWPIAGGTILGLWIQNDGGSGSFRYFVSSSQERFYNGTYTTRPADIISTAWTTSTKEPYIKIYYHGLKITDI